jgi:tRNA threonylcarbamoyladenosine biosynthesis protein TsaE
MSTSRTVPRVTLVAESTSAKRTQELAAALAGVVQPGDLLLLVGDLGAGKTTFVQGFAAGLGISETVTSPTFTLVRAYPCGDPTRLGSVQILLHADVYRLERLQEVLDLDIHELLEESAVAVVEWGDLAAPVLGDGALSVLLEPGDLEEHRTITLVGEGTWVDRAAILAAQLASWLVGEPRVEPGTPGAV